MRTASSAVFALMLCFLAWPVEAQEQTGVLQGRVVDASGAVLPGVTVTVRGPTIIGGAIAAVTGDSGAFRVPTIPIGIYRVTFELAGFGTKAYDDVRIQASTTFTLDATLGVGGLAETITVSGASPIIDTAATDVGFTFTKELMDTVPNARDAWAMVAQAPGVTTSTVNVGGTQTGNQVTFRGHGVDPASEHLHSERRERHRQHQQRRLAVLLRRRLVRRDAGRDQLSQRRSADAGHALEHRSEVGHQRHLGLGQPLLRRRSHSVGQRGRRTARVGRQPGEQPASSTSMPASMSADRSFATGSGSGAPIGIRKSRTSSPARSIPTAASRSTAPTSGIRQARSIGSRSAATTSPAISTWRRRSDSSDR